MLYFKNTALAEAKHVSLRTVLNWIEAAKQGKLDLTLHHEGNKTYIARTTKNVALIERMVADRKKYRNTRGFKAVSPKPEFYKTYSSAQILDIISNIDIHREIPCQYNYFGVGVDHWDKYAKRIAEEDTSNFIASTMELLEKSEAYLDDLLRDYKYVNVVDIGVGNALPVKGLIAHLLQQNKFGRYIALDVSPEMLRLAESNVRGWFGKDFPFEGHQFDMSYDRFTDKLAADYLKADTVNLVIMFGGTTGNLRFPDGAFRAFNDSMGRRDFFLYVERLDTDNSRNSFDFTPESTKAALDPHDRFCLDLLNIDRSFYDVEVGFDEHKKRRFIKLRMKIALAINFSLGGEEQTLELNKGECLLSLRIKHHGAFDVAHQLEHNDFVTIYGSQTLDEEYMLTISRIKSEH